MDHDLDDQGAQVLSAPHEIIKCDVPIVGGRFSGLSAAAELLPKGLSVVFYLKTCLWVCRTARLKPGLWSLDIFQEVQRQGGRC